MSYYIGIRELQGLAGRAVAKSMSANAGDTRAVASIPGLRRSPGVGNGNPLQYSCLENSRTGETGRLQSTGMQRVRRD